MLDRWVEGDLLPVTEKNGVGVICFSPLAQGLLSDKYLGGIPKDSRASTEAGFLKPQHITEQKVAMIRKLNELAKARGQSLPLQMAALAWGFAISSDYERADWCEQT